MRFRNIRVPLVVVLIVCATACGGGSSPTSTSGCTSACTTIDNPPVWSSFAWQFRGGFAVLNASASDPDGTATTIVCTGTLSRSYTGSANDSISITPTTAVQSLAESCEATSNGKSAGPRNGSTDAPAGITLRFSRMDAVTRSALTATGWGIPVGAQTASASADGTASVFVFPGRYSVGLPVGVSDAYNFVKFQLDPTQFKGDDSVRVLYPRFAGDTVTFSGATNVTLLQLAKSNADFDLGHFQAEFDDAVYGMQGIGPGSVRFLVTGTPTVPTMHSALRALFLTNVIDHTKQNASDMYAVTQGDTTISVPLVPRSSSVYLFQASTGGGTNHLFRGSRGEIIAASAGVHYDLILFSQTSIMNMVVSEGLTSIYGASAEEDPLCRKPSIFNDPSGVPNAAQCIDKTYYPVPTATDNVEGLQVLRHFANQAKKRALIEAQKLPANVIPFYFSTRAASQASLVGPAVPAGATLVPHGIQLRESPAGWHRRAARTEP